MLIYLIAWMNPWYIPLLFSAAGAAPAFALRRRSGRQYLWERFARLFNPLLFEMALVPSQACIALRDKGMALGPSW